LEFQKVSYRVSAPTVTPSTATVFATSVVRTISPTTTTTTTTMSAADQQAQLLFPPNVQYNASRVYSIKFLSSCFAGAVAGVLGLENTLGFALFILATLLTSACLYVKCKGRPAKYIPGGWWELVNPGQENISSFILVWTLFYGIVHVYD